MIISKPRLSELPHTLIAGAYDNDQLKVKIIIYAYSPVKRHINWGIVDPEQATRCHKEAF